MANDEIRRDPRHGRWLTTPVAAPFQREFVADDAAPAAARAFVNAAVDELVPPPHPVMLRDDIELVVSELVTNAVRAQSPTVTVEVGFERDRVVLRVEDLGSGWPEPREAGIHDTNGRGLALVSAICAAWGVRLSGPERKTVWAELTATTG